MAMIELVDFNEIYGKTATAAETGKKTRRGRSKNLQLLKLLTQKLKKLQQQPPVAEEMKAPVEGEAIFRKEQKNNKIFNI